MARFAQAGHHLGHSLAKRRGALGEDGDTDPLALLAFALVAALGQEQIGLVVAGLLEVEEVGLGPGFDDDAVVVFGHVDHLLSGWRFVGNIGGLVSGCQAAHGFGQQTDLGRQSVEGDGCFGGNCFGRRRWAFFGHIVEPIQPRR
jgi:hypothetical protein